MGDSDIPIIQQVITQPLSFSCRCIFLGNGRQTFKNCENVESLFSKTLKMMFGIAFKTGICVSAEQQYILQPRRFIFCSPVINCTYFRESMRLEGINTVFSSFPLNDLTKDFVNERQEKESECALCFYLFIFYLLLIY